MASAELLGKADLCSVAPAAGRTPMSTSDETSPRPKRRILWRMRRVFYAFAVLGVVAVGGAWLVLNTIELPEESEPIETTFVCDIDVAPGDCGFETALASLTAAEERVLVSYDELPAVLVQAVLATEDQNFFDHGGVDPFGITRAVVRDVLGDSQSQQGGSTITQQYVKAVFLTPERTLDRKLREAVLAIKLEQQLDKREILNRYLNQVYFGRGAYGVEAAAREYFGVGVGDLQLYQAAYLAGLIRSPESADATQDPQEASRRLQATLEAMAEEGYVTSEEAEQAGSVQWVTEDVAADGTPQVATIRPRTEKQADFNDVRFQDIGSEYWLELVRTQLRERLGTGIEARGLRVYTTFDPRLQRAAQDAVLEELDGEDAPLGSLVAIDNIGRIRAMVGGTDFENNRVNLALGTEGGGSGRPAGSTFKPLALASFVDQGYSTKSRFDAPATTSFPGVFASAGELWKPANYSKSSGGVQTVEEATWRSTNTVYAGIVDTIGPESLVDMAQRLGVRSPLDPNYSLVLGSGEVSVLDMASAYSTFAAHGRHTEPYVIRRIEDSAGNVLFDVSTEVVSEQVIPEEVADTVTSALQGVITRGTGTGAKLQVPAAGKTGTTDDYTDAWFAGYTCDMTAAVWMGYDEPDTMVYKGTRVSGGSFPADIWQAFMSEATEGDEPCDWEKVDAGEEVLNSRKVPSSQTTTTVAPTTTAAQESTTTAPGSATTAPASTTTAPATTAPANATPPP
jgi:penicillin-binding protein 1A